MRQARHESGTNATFATHATEGIALWTLGNARKSCLAALHMLLMGVLQRHLPQLRSHHGPRDTVLGYFVPVHVLWSRNSMMCHQQNTFVSYPTKWCAIGERSIFRPPGRYGATTTADPEVPGIAECRVNRCYHVAHANRRINCTAKTPKQDTVPTFAARIFPYSSIL